MSSRRKEPEIDDPYLVARVEVRSQMPLADRNHLIDPVTDFETFDRLGVDLVPSKRSPIGTQAYQLDMFEQ